MSRSTRLASVALVGVALSGAAPAVAWAHGDGGATPAVVASAPKPNQVVTERIDSVSVQFNIALANLRHDLSVVDAAGARVDNAKISYDGRTLRVGLVPLTRSGPYTVRFKAYASGHEIPGGYAFSYDGPTDVPKESNLQVQMLALGGGVLILGAGTLLALSRLRASEANASR